MIDGTPLWHAPTPMPATHDPVDRVDTVVVGGGITGLVAGIELLEGGASVMICDAMAPGEGASGRAFGSIALGSSAPLGSLRRRHGDAMGERLWRESSAAAEELRTYLDMRELDGDYRRTGHVRLAVHAAHEHGLRSDYETWCRLLGEEGLQLLPAADLPGANFRLGLLDEHTATIDPYRYVASLLEAFSRRGGRYVERCRVNALCADGDGFIVRHAKGATRTQDVAITTNGHTGGLHAWIERRIFPVGSYMIATEPMDAPQRAIFGARLRVHTTAFHLKNYFRMTPEGRLIFGGRSRLSVGMAPTDVAAELRRSMLAYFPELADVAVTHAWGGCLGFTFDQMPHIGVRDGMHYAMGYCGRGLPMATLFGRSLAAAVLSHGQRADLMHRDVPFPSRWYYRRRPWFLPLAAAHYRWLDRRSASVP